MVKRASYIFHDTNRKKRPGVHAKTKASKMKNSKNYLKKYNQQGK